MLQSSSIRNDTPSRRPLPCRSRLPASLLPQRPQRLRQYPRRSRLRCLKQLVESRLAAQLNLSILQDLDLTIVVESPVRSATLIHVAPRRPYGPGIGRQGLLFTEGYSADRGEKVAIANSTNTSPLVNEK